MRRKHDVINAPDYKDSDGIWRRTYIEKGLSCKSRSAVLYDSISYRAESKVDTRYSEVMNLFNGFNEFTEWCQDQYGYLFKEANGKHWSIDKDILNPEFRHYSPENCLFVPERVNNFFAFTKQGRDNGLPVGVYKPEKSYIAGIHYDGNRKHLGSFSTPEDAHRAWQKAKIELIDRFMLNDREVYEHEKLAVAMQRYKELIEFQLSNNIQTQRF